MVHAQGLATKLIHSNGLTARETHGLPHDPAQILSPFISSLPLKLDPPALAGLEIGSIES